MQQLTIKKGNKHFIMANLQEIDPEELNLSLDDLEAFFHELNARFSNQGWFDLRLETDQDYSSLSLGVVGIRNETEEEERKRLATKDILKQKKINAAQRKLKKAQQELRKLQEAG